MKKILIPLFLLTASLIGNAPLAQLKTTVSAAPTLTVKAPAESQVYGEEEDDDDETEALPVAAQSSEPSKTESTLSTTTSQPSSTSKITEPTAKVEPPVAPQEDTRSVAFFNTTGHPITLYGKKEGSPDKTLATFKINEAPARIINIPTDIETIYVKDLESSTIFTVDPNAQLIIIKIENSAGSFTYTFEAVVPEYTNYMTIYNATNTDLIVIMQTSAKIPGIFGSTTTTQKYTYTIPAQKMLMITIPQLALPAIQDKKVQCGLPNSETPLIINSDEQNMFIITQDNDTPVIHKI